MKPILFRIWFVLVCGLFLTVLQAAPPEVENKAPADDRGNAAVVKADTPGFQALIERVRRLEASGEWRRDGWGAGEIEESLERLLDDVRRATGRDDLKAGVALAGLQPGGALGPRVQNALWVLKDAKVSFAERCVFLVDGSFEVGFANDCVIIASGAVRVGHGQGNLIVAGQYLHTSHDGGREERGSVLVSGNVLDVSHARGSICSAPGLLRIAHAGGATFINSPNVEVSHRTACRSVDAPPLALAPAAARNVLEGKLNVTQVVRGRDEGRGAMAVIQQGGVEVVVRPGAPITDETGKPVEALAGWTLAFAGADFALFRKESDFAGFVVPSHR